MKFDIKAITYYISLNFAPLKALLLSLALLLNSTTKATELSVLIFSERAELDLGKTQNMFDYIVSHCLHRTLIQYGALGDLEGGIAQSWTISSDRLSYIFKIKNLRFHDGTLLTPYLVRDSLQYSLSSGSDVAQILSPFVQTIRTLDDKTLEIVLNRPFDPFLKGLTSSDMAILKIQNGKPLFKIGLGNYRLDIKSNYPKELLLQDSSNNNTIHIHYSLDAKRLANTKSSIPIDLVLGLPNELAQKYKTKKLQLHDVTNLSYSIFLFNEHRHIAPNDRKKISQAVLNAVKEFLDSQDAKYLSPLSHYLPDGIFPNVNFSSKTEKKNSKKMPYTLRIAFPIGWWPDLFLQKLQTQLSTVASKVEIVRLKKIRTYDLSTIDLIPSDYILPFSDAEAALPGFDLAPFNLTAGTEFKKFRQKVQAVSGLAGQDRVAKLFKIFRAYFEDGWAIPLFSTKVSILKSQATEIGDATYQFERLLCQ